MQTRCAPVGAQPEAELRQASASAGAPAAPPAPIAVSAPPPPREPSDDELQAPGTPPGLGSVRTGGSGAQKPCVGGGLAGAPSSPPSTPGGEEASSTLWETVPMDVREPEGAPAAPRTVTLAEARGGASGGTLEGDPRAGPPPPWGASAAAAPGPGEPSGAWTASFAGGADVAADRGAGQCGHAWGPDAEGATGDVGMERNMRYSHGDTEETEPYPGGGGAGVVGSGAFSISPQGGTPATSPVTSPMGSPHAGSPGQPQLLLLGAERPALAADAASPVVSPLLPLAAIATEPCRVGGGETGAHDAASPAGVPPRPLPAITVEPFDMFAGQARLLRSF
jgi:hypothetical protein